MGAVVEYGVITAVPDNPADGNLHSGMTDIFVKVGHKPRPEGYGVDDVVKLLPDVVGAAASLNYLLPTFHVGQILVLDASGRECSYPGRKPSKWNVTCEHFDTVEDAITRAREINGR